MSSYEIIFVICHMQQMSKDIKTVIFCIPCAVISKNYQTSFVFFDAKDEDKYPCFYSRVTPGIFRECHMHFFLISRWWNKSKPAFACKSQTFKSLHSHALLILIKSFKSQNQVVYEQKIKDPLNSTRSLAQLVRNWTPEPVIISCFRSIPIGSSFFCCC